MELSRREIFDNNYRRIGTLNFVPREVVIRKKPSAKAEIQPEPLAKPVIKVAKQPNKYVLYPEHKYCKKPLGNKIRLLAIIQILSLK